MKWSLWKKTSKSSFCRLTKIKDSIPPHWSIRSWEEGQISCFPLSDNDWLLGFLTTKHATIWPSGVRYMSTAYFQGKQAFFWNSLHQDCKTCRLSSKANFLKYKTVRIKDWGLRNKEWNKKKLKNWRKSSSAADQLTTTCATLLSIKCSIELLKPCQSLFQSTIL